MGSVECRFLNPVVEYQRGVRYRYVRNSGQQIFIGVGNPCLAIVVLRSVAREPRIATVV